MTSNSSSSDRSEESVLAYNSRVQELNLAKYSQGNVSHTPFGQTWKDSNPTSTVRNWTPSTTTPPPPTSNGMSNQDVIAHNKSATRIKDLILPPDRSPESVQAYNERVAELTSGIS